MQLHLYYGDGKGKTTAALGQALRAWGHGWRVLVVQFLKEAGAVSGEVQASAAIRSRWKLFRLPLPCSVHTPPSGSEKEELRRVTRSLWERSHRELSARRYHLVVLDEVLVAWRFGLLSIRDIMGMREAVAAAGVELLIVTGKWAPRGIVRVADLVTEVRKVKHPYDRKVRARDGIDY